MANGEKMGQRDERGGPTSVNILCKIEKSHNITVFFRWSWRVTTSTNAIMMQAKGKTSKVEKV